MVSRVYRVVKGCPLCEGDVRGNLEIFFFCKPCNMRFRTEHLVLDTHKSHLDKMSTKKNS